MYWVWVVALCLPPVDARSLRSNKPWCQWWHRAAQAMATKLRNQRYPAVPAVLELNVQHLQNVWPIKCLIKSAWEPLPNSFSLHAMQLDQLESYKNWDTERPLPDSACFVIPTHRPQSIRLWLCRSRANAAGHPATSATLANPGGGHRGGLPGYRLPQSHTNSHWSVGVTTGTRWYTCKTRTCIYIYIL